MRKLNGQHDAAGYPVSDSTSPELQAYRKKRAGEAAARAHLDAQRAEWTREARNIAPALRDEQRREAQRVLDEQAAEMEAELAWRRSLDRPNPWLRPWDPEYNSGEQRRLRREEAARREAHASTTRSSTGDRFADTANEMEATMDRIHSSRQTNGLRTSSQTDREHETGISDRIPGDDGLRTSSRTDREHQAGTGTEVVSGHPATLTDALRSMSQEDITRRGWQFASHRDKLLGRDTEQR